MRISVENQINPELKEIFYFNQFDFNIVFVEYNVLEKPKGKRTWKIKNKWDKYAREYLCNIKEPELSEDIRKLAFEQTSKLIKIKTWTEWKTK